MSHSISHYFHFRICLFNMAVLSVRHVCFLSVMCQFECETLGTMPEETVVAFSKIMTILHLTRCLASQIIRIKRIRRSPGRNIT